MIQSLHLVSTSNYIDILLHVESCFGGRSPFQILKYVVEGGVFCCLDEEVLEHVHLWAIALLFVGCNVRDWVGKVEVCGEGNLVFSHALSFSFFFFIHIKKLGYRFSLQRCTNRTSLIGRVWLVVHGFVRF